MSIDDLLVKAGVPVVVVTFFSLLIVFPEKVKTLFRVGGKSEREVLSEDESGFRKHLLERVDSLEACVKVAASDRVDLYARLDECTKKHNECEASRLALERRLDAFIMNEGASAIDKVLSIGTVADTPRTAQDLLTDSHADSRP